MGIRGLTTYVDTLPFGEEKVWEPYNLRDTNLVIDGCGLYYYLYASNRLNFKYGGQYDLLQKKVKEFFSKLQSNNVVSYVVIDGIMTRDEKKFDTHVKRKEERITRMKNLWTSRNLSSEIVIPRLVQLAFVQVLQEIKVPYVLADFEADCEIASLANELDAPVMASDSDFYIFNIKRGYIPFKYNRFSDTNIEVKNIEVKKFSFDGFCKHLGIDPGMSPLLASLVGNDYISDIMLRPFTTHIQKLFAGSEKCMVPTIAKFLSKYKSVSKAVNAVISLSPKDDPEFEKALHLSLEEYQAKQSNLIGYFHSGDLSCDIVTFNCHCIPQWVVKLYREGSIAFEGLSCLCNRKMFLRTQCEDTSLPSAQTCVQDLRWYYYALVLHCEDTGIGVPVTELQPQSKPSIPSMVTHGQIELGTDFDHTLRKGLTPDSQAHRETNCCDTSSSGLCSINEVGDKTNLTEKIKAIQISENAMHSCDPAIKDINVARHDSTTQATHTSNTVTDKHTTEEIIVTELDREGSTLAHKKVNLTLKVLETKIQIHDIPEMSDIAKKSHLLSLLDSDLPYIRDLPIIHQLVVSALRYWVSHSNVKEIQLTALLVHYVGEKRTSISKPIKISIEAVHGFSQWQNVLYWVERLNSLFSTTFPQPEVAKLYNGVHVCLVYDRLRVVGIKLAESIVTNTDLYRQLYDVITKDLPRDCQFNQSRRSQRPTPAIEGKQTKAKSKDCLKGNKFALLCEESDSDED